MSHRSNLTVPEQDGNMENRSDSEHRDMTVVAVYKPEEDDQSVHSTKAEINGLIRKPEPFKEV